MSLRGKRRVLGVKEKDSNGLFAAGLVLKGVVLSVVSQVRLFSGPLFLL